MADGAFNNPLTGAGGSLTVNQVKSPNFVNGVSGWIIRKDGTAQFNSIVIPPGSGGSTVFVQGTTPTALHVNDLWVNTANANSIYAWNGSAWTQYQFGTGSIQAGAITAALIAANTITAAQIAANTITAGQIAAGTITATQIAAGTIDATRLGPNAVTAANVAANQFGLNMVADPQFTQSALNTIRATDAFSTGSWTFSSNTAICAATTGGARLALMPSAVPPMWVAPGEQYYVSCTFTTTAANSTLFVTISTDGGNAQVSQSGVAAGTHTVSGVVTIPAGAHTGYFRFSCLNGSSNATTVSNPICQPAALFSPTISGTDYIISPAGAFFYSGTPALGNLIASITQADGSDSFGNTYYTGFCSYVASGGATPTLIGQFNVGAVSFGNSTAFGGSATNAPGAVGPIAQGHLSIDSGSAGTGSDAFIDLMSKDKNATQGAGAVVVQGVLSINTPDIPVADGGNGYTLYADINGEPSLIQSSGFIGAVPAIGRDWNHTGTINSASFSNILSVAVASGHTYKFDMHLYLSAAHSAGQWQIQVAGPTFSFLQYAFKWESAAGASGLNVNRTTLSATQAGPSPSVAGAYWAEVHGYITTTASGHIVIKAASSTGATDTWTYYENSTLEVQEIS